ncbi:MAG: putative DNA modification/repair radical SAM protein [Eggerthellaceae bacterium]|nr:putative DNA modification/repair radical SAM protein [Eggerthellaceae bacterium]
MDIVRKLEILSDAAKYDVACTSSGVDRAGKRGQLGAASAAGCCHSFTEDGRCISLLKVLMTNVCTYDCAYCVNRRSNAEVERTAFTPQELADLTIGFYRRNYIEGLFLSSGVIGNADRTTELMIETLRILREDYGFRGYIHAKAVPNASLELVDKLGYLADRLSVNLELPSSASLKLLCPDKTRQSVLKPMKRISEAISEDSESRAMVRRRKTVYMSATRPRRAQRAFAPAGQSTQMIVGATPETDHQILGLAASLYKSMQLKRVFFSAYLPVVADPRLPSTDRIQLDREHRLYQADWLMRFYGFSVEEIIDEANPNLATDVDPKANWALNHLDLFPVEVNTASRDMLLRVPGIGVRGAKLIMRARKQSTLGEDELRRLGIALKRARYFITCGGKHLGRGVEFSPEVLHAKLAAPIDGGSHGRRADKLVDGQMSLFSYASVTGDFALEEASPDAAGPARVLEAAS